MADLKPAYLITGSDRPKVARALRRLRYRVGDDATELLTAHEATGEDVVAACNAMGLFATERRLVIVEDVEVWKAAESKPVVDYLADPSGATVLALVATELKADSKLAKAVADAGEVLAYNIPKRGSRNDVPGWVTKQFAAHGVKVDTATSRTLVGLVGDDLQELGADTVEANQALGFEAGSRFTEATGLILVETPRFCWASRRSWRLMIPSRLTSVLKL